MSRPAIERGTRFARLEVLSEAGFRGPHRTYWCRCDCGALVELAGRHLKQNTKSCGCLRRELAIEKGRAGGGANFKTHGLAHHPLYVTWKRMRQRCNDPNDLSYPHYGGRGVYVDRRWNDFAQFLADMGEKPGPEYSIDRIDNDGPYSPENCRWATRSEQNGNRTRRYTVGQSGQTKMVLSC